MAQRYTETTSLALSQPRSQNFLEKTENISAAVTGIVTFSPQVRGYRNARGEVHEPLWHATVGENAVSGSPSLTPGDTEESNDDNIHRQIYCLAVARHL